MLTSAAMLDNLAKMVHERPLESGSCLRITGTAKTVRYCALRVACHKETDSVHPVLWFRRSIVQTTNLRKFIVYFAD